MRLKDFDFRIWDNSTDKFIELAISDNIRAIPRKNDDLVLELWSGFYDSKGANENRDKGYTNNKLECLQVLGNIHENENLLKGGQ